jgi:transcriptional regulatory protein LevR
MHTKRRRETIEQARGVAPVCIALRKIGRSPESEQRKKYAHEQQAKADQRAWINECRTGGGAFFHIRNS